MAQGAVVALLLFVHLLGKAEAYRFESRVAALHSEGAPVAPEDLKTPPVPDDRNAAKLLEEAERLLEGQREREEFDITSLDVENATPEQRDGMRRYLERLGPYFELLAKVPERPEWHVELRWDEDSGWPLDDTYAWLQDACTHLRARVELDQEFRGRTERAARTSVLLVDLAERCPTRMLLWYIARRALESQSAAVLRAASRQSGFDAALFRRLVEPRLAIENDAPELKRAFAEERVHFIWLFRELGRGKVPRDYADYLFLGGRLHTSFFWRPVLYLDANRLLDFFEDAIAASAAPPDEAEATASRLGASWAGGPHGVLLSGDTAQFFSRLLLVRPKFLATRRLARVVMALLEYRQRERAWPESLADLGDLPVDPYSGKPFVYERIENGARIRAAADEPWDQLEEDNLAWTLDDRQIATRPG